MRHLVTIAAGILTAVFVSVGAANSQSAPPDAIAAAKEFVEAAKTAEQFKTLMPLIMQQLKPMVVQGRAAVEKDFDAIAPAMMDLANERVGKFTEAIVVIHASNFTADELRQVTAFYRTPAGEKFRDKTGLIAQQSMVMGQKFGEQLMQDLQTRIKEELRKRGHNI
jgi:hypothetical protein